MKFLAVHWVGLMTHREYCVDCPFPYHMTGVGWELSPPPPPVFCNLKSKFPLSVKFKYQRFNVKWSPMDWYHFWPFLNLAELYLHLRLGASLPSQCTVFWHCFLPFFPGSQKNQPKHSFSQFSAPYSSIGQRISCWLLALAGNSILDRDLAKLNVLYGGP